MSYIAYNKHYIKGRPVGHKYKVASGTTAKEARRKAEQDNRIWNKKFAPEGHVAKLVEVKKVGVKKKKRGVSSRFDFGFNF